MGQSYVIGDQSHLEVRDSTFEIVLGRLLAELEREPASDAKEVARGILSAWTQYWESMPPGCKDLDVRGLPKDVRALLRAMLARIRDAAPASSETALVAEQVGILLD